jgi:hypothetical protein
MGEGRVDLRLSPPSRRCGTGEGGGGADILLWTEGVIDLKTIPDNLFLK